MKGGREVASAAAPCGWDLRMGAQLQGLAVGTALLPSSQDLGPKIPDTPERYPLHCPLTPSGPGTSSLRKPKA